MGGDGKSRKEEKAQYHGKIQITRQNKKEKAKEGSQKDIPEQNKKEIMGKSKETSSKNGHKNWGGGGRKTKATFEI